MGCVGLEASIGVVFAQRWSSGLFTSRHHFNTAACVVCEVFVFISTAYERIEHTHSNALHNVRSTMCAILLFDHCGRMGVMFQSRIRSRNPLKQIKKSMLLCTPSWCYVAQCSKAMLLSRAMLPRNFYFGYTCSHFGSCCP